MSLLTLVPAKGQADVSEELLTLRKTHSDLLWSHARLRAQHNQLLTDYGSLNKKFTQAQEKTRSARARQEAIRSQSNENSRLADHRLRRIKMLEQLADRRLERIKVLETNSKQQSRLIDALIDEIRQLRFLLQGSLYINFLSGIIRRFRIRNGGPRRRSRKWQRVVQRRAHLIGGRHCELCGVKADDRTIILGHHIIAHVDGGPNTVENCQLRCERCEQHYHEQ